MPIRLKSKSMFPPQGWRYRQPETGWTIPEPMSTNYDQAVREIQAHRKLNPGFPFPTTYEACDWDLENYTCLRLKNSPQFCASDDPATPNPIQVQRATKKSGCAFC